MKMGTLGLPHMGRTTQFAIHTPMATGTKDRLQFLSIEVMP
jgi:hypothetical protein